MAQIHVSEVYPYDSNPKYGYVILTSNQPVIVNGWVQEKSRTAILRGEVSLLKKLPKTLPGRITVTECLEDNIPERFISQFDETKSFEQNIEPYLKRAGHGGPVLTQNGKYILRFTEYDPTDSVPDVRVPHDNHEEVKVYRILKENKGSNQ